tara:strand:- start:17 stop:199 length:183 start_codon:yes stop_codon:yes gene_type:complete
VAEVQGDHLQVVEALERQDLMAETEMIPVAKIMVAVAQVQAQAVQMHQVVPQVTAVQARP